MRFENSKIFSQNKTLTRRENWLVTVDLTHVLSENSSLQEKQKSPAAQSPCDEHLSWSYIYEALMEIKIIIIQLHTKPHVILQQHCPQNHRKKQTWQPPLEQSAVATAQKINETNRKSRFPASPISEKKGRTWLEFVRIVKKTKGEVKWINMDIYIDTHIHIYIYIYFLSNQKCKINVNEFDYFPFSICLMTF